MKARTFRIDAMAEDKRFGAELTQTMLKNVEAYLACCQLGITMASLGLGWVGEPTVSAIVTPLLQPLGMPEETIHLIAFLIGFLVFSSLHIVIGEQVPKTFAIRNPEPVSLWIAYPLHASFILLYPLNWLLNNASRGVLRMLGVKEAPHHDVLTETEIEDLVVVSAEHGHVEKRRKRERIVGSIDLGRTRSRRRDDPSQEHQVARHRLAAARNPGAGHVEPAHAPAALEGRSRQHRRRPARARSVARDLRARPRRLRHP